MRARLPRLTERTRRLTAARRGHAPARTARPEEEAHPGSGSEETPIPGDPPGAPGPIDTPERLARASGGPQDSALYTCTCGYVFDASVSTSVHCPHCGDTQAW